MRLCSIPFLLRLRVTTCLESMRRFLHRNTRSHHSINVLEERNTVTNIIRMDNQGLANALFTGLAINSDRGGQCVVLK